jgi:hypothetical protein
MWQRCNCIYNLPLSILIFLPIASDVWEHVRIKSKLNIINDISLSSAIAILRTFVIARAQHLQRSEEVRTRSMDGHGKKQRAEHLAYQSRATTTFSVPTNQPLATKISTFLLDQISTGHQPNEYWPPIDVSGFRLWIDESERWRNRVVSYMCAPSPCTCTRAGSTGRKWHAECVTTDESSLSASPS